MSFEAMTWAVKMPLPAMQKIVLLMLADRASSDTNDCFPSLNRLAFDCGMDKSSVIRQLNKLEASGFIQKKKSRSDFYGNESNTYLLNVNDSALLASCTKQQGSSRKKQALLQNETTVVAEKHQPSCTEQTTLVAQSDTNLSIEPINKPIIKPIYSEIDLLHEFGIVGDLADDFIAHRKSKKANISKTVLNSILSEAVKANVSLKTALETMILRNWQGFKAEWLLPKEANNEANQSTGNGGSRKQSPTDAVAAACGYPTA